MSKTKSLHCSHCGAKLLKTTHSADRYYGGAWWGFTKSRYATYDEDGKLQKVNVWICPNYNKKKWWHLRPSKHDYLWAEIKGVKYRMNYDDIISYL